MSDAMENPARDDIPLASDSESPPAELAAELPPVEPPSAGFIIQLFVVPALIVLLIVGVWALFGKLASGTQDWQKLVQELGHPNPNRHQRAAVGLGQMLRADLEMGQQGDQLSRNSAIAEALSGLLKQRLATPTDDPKKLQQQAFLARTLGLLDVPDQVLPVLVKATSTDQNPDIRKDALAAIAMIFGRVIDRKEVPADESVLQSLIESTRDDDPGIRQISTYALGLFPQDEALLRLEVLLDNVDSNTRINAAIGLARNGSVAGVPLFKEFLREAAEPFDPADLEDLGPEERARRMELKVRQEPLILKNSFRAITDLREEIDGPERSALVALLEPLSSVHANQMVRVEARKLALMLAP